MTSAPSDCPTREQLAALANGELAESLVDSVLQHVQECAACRDTLNNRFVRKSGRKKPVAAAVDAMAIVENPAFQRAVAEIEHFGSSPRVPLDMQPNFAEDTESLIGRQIGQYQIVSRLGAGGMGTVYKAIHTRLDKVVSLKFLPAARLASTECIARFEREMVTVGRLNHPHIVSATDAREIDGLRFLVMEYLDGLDLSALIELTGPLRVADACEIVRQAAQGLEYAHTHNLIHRDIKPSNLLLTSQAVVKILDLGLALVRSEETVAEPLTSTHQIMGTVDYMAPEQIDRSHAVDGRADLYALGCTLYKLLAGQAPFGHLASATNYHRMKAHVETTPIPIHQHRADIPQELSDILDRLLAKEPAARFQNAGELLVALEPLTQGADLPALYRKAQSQPECESTHVEARPETVASLASHLVDTDALPPATNDAIEKRATAASPRNPRTTKPQPIRSRARGLLALASMLTLLIAATVVIRLVTNKGEIIIKSFDPSLEIVIKRNGRVVDEFEVRQRPGSISYYAGEFEIEIKGGDTDDVTIRNRTFTLTRDDEKVVEIIRSTNVADPATMPPPGIAPDQRPEAPRQPHVLLPPTWEPASAGSQLNRGLIPAPSKLPGIAGWQLFTRQPRGGFQELAWSPDGHWIAATVGAENTVRLYDAESGELARVLPQQSVPRSIYRGGLEFSPDSQWLVTIDIGKAAYPRLWKVDGTAGMSWPHLEAIRDTDWHPTSEWLAVGSPYENAFILHRDSGQVLRLTTDGQASGADVVDWSPDGKWLATSSVTKNVTQLWTLDGTFVQGQEGVFADWRPDSRQFAVVDIANQQARICTLDGQVEATFDGYIDVTWRPDGEGAVFISASADNSEVQYRPNSPEDAPFAPLATIRKPGLPGERCWSSDGSTLAILGNPALNRSANLFHVLGDEMQRGPLSMVPPGLSAMALSPDGKQLAFGYASAYWGPREDHQAILGVVNTDDLASREFTSFLPKAVDLDWHPSGEQFASAARDGTIRLWDKEGLPLKTIQAHDTWVSRVRWDANGSRLDSLTNDGEQKSWDVPSWSPLSDDSVQPTRLHAAVFHVHRQVPITFHSDNLPLEELQDVPDRIRTVVWSHDEKVYAALAADQKTIYVGDRKQPAPHGVNFLVEVLALALSPDGSTLVVLIRDDAAPLVLVDTHSGEPTAPQQLAEENLGLATAIQWSPDGTKFAVSRELFGRFVNGVVICHADGTPGVPLQYAGLMHGMCSVAFSPDGTKLLASGSDCIAHWELSSGTLERIAIPLPRDQAVVLSPAGETLFQSAEADAELVYVVEREMGKYETLSPAEFRALLPAE